MQVILAYLMFDRSNTGLEPELLPRGRGPRAWIFREQGWRSCLLDEFAGQAATLLAGADRAIFVLEDSAATPEHLCHAIAALTPPPEVFLLLHSRTLEHTVERVSQDFPNATCRRVDSLQHELWNPAYNTCCELLAGKRDADAFWERWTGAQHTILLNQLAVLCAIQQLKPDPTFQARFNDIKQHLPQRIKVKLNLQTARYWDKNRTLVASELISDIDHLVVQLAAT